MEEETGFKRLKCKAALSKTKLTKDHFLLVETCYIFFEVTHYTMEEVQKYVSIACTMMFLNYPSIY